MIKHSKKLFTMLLSASLMLSALPFTGTAYADPVISDEYSNCPLTYESDLSDEPLTSPYYHEMKWNLGNGVTAEYNAGDLIITTDNNGIISDYDKADKPWKDYSKYVKTLTVNGNYDYIGNKAFSDLTNLRDAYIRGKVDKIGDLIFYNCPRNMELYLVVETEDELSQTNPTRLEIDRATKGSGIGCYMLFEGDIEADDSDDEYRTVTEYEKYESAEDSDYSGSVNNSQIKPKNTIIKKVKATQTSLTVTWKKQTKKVYGRHIKGYQIQIATNKSFTKNVKKYSVKGYKKTSYKIKGLKSGKKYFVRIRTFIKSGKSNKYSDWSKATTKRTKYSVGHKKK